MLENLRLSFQSIWAHKLRSFLTMLGIIIGIAAVIAIVSTIMGTNEEIKNELIGAGSNVVNVTLKKNGADLNITSSSDIPYGVPEVSDGIRQQILDLDTVENVTCYSERSYYYDGVYYENTDFSGINIRGIDRSYFDTMGYVVRNGRSFIDNDYENFRTVVIIDSITAENFFPNEDPVGKTLEINSTPFTIVGVVTETSNYEASINTVWDYYTYADTSAGYLFIPKSSWPVVFCFDEPENVSVKATSTDDMEKAGADTQNILNTMIPESQTDVTYDAENLLEQARELEALSNATNNQLIWIASISLLVGGIGVMNIMMVSVTERTSEIGLKKAIGAKRARSWASSSRRRLSLPASAAFWGLAQESGFPMPSAICCRLPWRSVCLPSWAPCSFPW